MSCAPGCRWLARGVTFGPDVLGNFFSPRCAPSLLRALPLVPVGYVVQPDGRLAHREGGALIRGPADLPDIVGWIEEGRVTADGVDMALHFVDEAAQIRRALIELDRARQLHAMGVSVVLRFDTRVTGPRVIDEVDGVLSLDFVSHPANPHNTLRRRLPCAGWESAIRDSLLRRGEHADKH